MPIVLKLSYTGSINSLRKREKNARCSSNLVDVRGGSKIIMGHVAREERIQGK